MAKNFVFPAVLYTFVFPDWNVIFGGFQTVFLGPIAQLVRST